MSIDPTAGAYINIPADSTLTDCSTVTTTTSTAGDTFTITGGTIVNDPTEPPVLEDEVSTENVQELQIGTFNIPRKWIDQEPDAVQELMGSCLIIKAESGIVMSGDHIHYTAISPAFELRKSNKSLKHYPVTMVRDTENGEVVVKFSSQIDFIKGVGEKPSREQKGVPTKIMRRYLHAAKSIDVNGVKLDHLSKNELIAFAAKATEEANTSKDQLIRFQQEAQQPQMQGTNTFWTQGSTATTTSGLVGLGGTVAGGIASNANAAQQARQGLTDITTTALDLANAVATTEVTKSINKIIR